MKQFPRYFLLIFCFTSLSGSLTSCSRKGLISEMYPDIAHTVDRPIDSGRLDQNPTFIVIGDIQPGYWIREKFLAWENWYTPKMFIAPFYQLYLLGSGIYGIAEYLMYNHSYGFRGREMMRDAVLREFNRSDADFFLCAGDFVSDGRYPDHWRRFHHENTVGHSLLNKIPLLPVIGNHENYHDKEYGEKNYHEIFRHPPFYTIEFPDAALFVIDSNIIIDNRQFIDDDEQDTLFNTWIVSPEGSDTPSWLESKLASSDKPFKILAMHHPLMSFSKHYHDWKKKDFGRDLDGKRKRLITLLQEHGVQVVFCGHAHLYEHNILRYQNVDDEDQRELHFIVGGSGGVPFRKKSRSSVLKNYHDEYMSQGYDVIQAAYEELFCYSLVAIESGKIDIKMFEVTGKPGEGSNVRDQIVIPRR